MAATESITLLFTDLVGSTQISSSLPPESADELRRVHFSALRDAIAAAGGEEVKSLGDGLMVEFGATGPALACAVAMQQAIERQNRKSPVSLGIRIGISSGDVTVEEGDYFGEPVIEAARLCAAAQGGQILTSDVVKRLARRSGQVFTTERELDLKGLPEPVVAWELVWEYGEGEEGGSGIPLPARLPRAPFIGMVGRTQELARLKETFKETVAAGRPWVVLISGEAGVGKSTLLSSLAHDAHAEDAVVLYGRCDEDLAIPYRPFVEALGHYVAHAPDHVLVEVGDEHLAVLVRLLPDLRKRRPELRPAASSEPDADRWLLYRAVVALLERTSAEVPVLLIADDLHWSDTPTLQLLRHISSNLTGPVLLVGEYRETELSASHPLTETLAALVPGQAVVRVPLSGLEDNEVVTFVEAAAGQALDEGGLDLAHALYRETDGNPFFVAEVLRHLVETGAIVQEQSGRWVPTRDLFDVGLPESVRQVIGSRVRRLGDEATRVLSAASVLGQEFDVELLSAVVSRDEDSVLDVLEASSSAALVAEDRAAPGRFRFAHALVQHTLYDDLGATRRARLHRAAAECLEEQLGQQPGARASEVARHWLAATRPARSSKAVTYARLAGESALLALAPAEAIRWFNEGLAALAYAPDETERARCLAALGEAQRQLGYPEYRDTLLDAAWLAQRTEDVDTLVRAALANNRGIQSVTGEVDTDRVAVLDAALRAVGPGDSTSRARLLALLALERTFDADYSARRAWADEALRMARRSRDPATILDVLLRRRSALRMPDTVGELLAESIEAQTLANEIGDVAGAFWATTFRAQFSMDNGDIGEVVRCHTEIDRIASELGQPIFKWTSAYMRSWSTLLAGDVASAGALADEALQIGTETGQPDALVIYGTQHCTIRWQQGRAEEIVDFVVGVAADNPGIPAYRAGAAHMLVESGREDEARAMLREELRSGFSVRDDPFLSSYLDLWGRVASHLGDREAARVLYERLAHWGDLITFTGTALLGAMAHNLGTLAATLGRDEDAEAHFAQALTTHERIEAPFFIALTQLEWGRMLVSGKGSSGRGRGRTMLHSARELARRYGYAAIEKRVDESLDASG